MAKKFRDRALVVAIAFAALAAGYFAYSWPTSPTPNLTELLAANFGQLDGKTSKISDWHGKVRVVNFWATWCPPCREEIPGFIRLQEKYRDQGIVFIGVALDKEDKVRTFAEETGINYPILLAEYHAMEYAKKAGNGSSTLPFTVLIARDGGFAWAFSGVVSEPQLEAIIENFL